MSRVSGLARVVASCGMGDSGRRGMHPAANLLVCCDGMTPWRSNKPRRSFRRCSGMWCAAFHPTFEGGSDVHKALFLAAAAGGLLVSSAPPHRPAPTEEGVGYPPCSRRVRDRCIPLNARGDAGEENLAINRGEDS